LANFIYSSRLINCPPTESSVYFYKVFSHIDAYHNNISIRGCQV
jgi:hypothetical protein